jgi:RecA/RadA recombinase
MNDDAAKAKKAMTMSTQVRVYNDKDFLSTGLTLLNLACYGRTNGGMLKGKIYRAIGKSQSSKSFLCRTILAEAANNPEFDDYELIHDDIERGVLLDNLKFFGTKLAKRVCAPSYSKEKRPIYSSTIMSLYDKMNEKLAKRKKFIWIVDSQDSLTSEGTTKMGDGKAKIHADQMRQIIDPLEENGCILIFVQHAKVNLGWAFGQDVTTGGASPEFYSSLDIRLAKLGAIKKTIGEQKFPIGNWIAAHVTKNRVSGLDRTIKFPLYIEYGIDDIGSCVEFLILNDTFKKGKGGIITAEDLDFEGTTSKLIKHIEKNNLQVELRVLTGKTWKRVEDACSLHRKPRYS